MSVEESEFNLNWDTLPTDDVIAEFATKLATSAPEPKYRRNRNHLAATKPSEKPIATKKLWLRSDPEARVLNRKHKWLGGAVGSDGAGTRPRPSPRLTPDLRILKHSAPLDPRPPLCIHRFPPSPASTLPSLLVLKPNSPTSLRHPVARRGRDQDRALDERDHGAGRGLSRRQLVQVAARRSGARGRQCHLRHPGGGGVRAAHRHQARVGFDARRVSGGALELAWRCSGIRREDLRDTELCRAGVVGSNPQ